MSSAAKRLRPALRPLAIEHRRADWGAVALILVLTTVAAWGLVVGGTMVGMDTATQFYPWYSYLGERLGSFELPGWNPSQFSGAPFAGDPLSGWTYLPAMIFFTLLPIVAAAKSYLVFHLLLAGLSTYAFARALRMGVAGAVFSAVAYEFTSYLYVQNVCCTAFASVYAWLPLTLLGAEMAIRSQRWTDLGLWWAVSGLGLSQILASWLGQGSYYALLALGGFVAYRTLIFPPEHLRGARERIFGAALHGGGILLFGFGLAAAGILPRLEYNALSNLAGGYPGPQVIAGGWNLEHWALLLGPTSMFYAGVATLSLALAAPFVAGRKFAVPYFAVLAVGALTLSGQGITPLHEALYLLPRFDQLHPRSPERILLLFYLSAALLAGATLSRLGERGRRAPALLLLPVLAALFLVTRSTLKPPVEPSDGKNAALEALDPLQSILVERGISIPPAAFLALLLAVWLVAVYALLPARLAWLRGITILLLVLVVFADLFTAGRATLEQRMNEEGGEAVQKMDLAGYYAPTEVTRFLESAGPARYFGYLPKITGGGTTVPYSIRFDEPVTRSLQPNNRATLWEGMQSTQGYNAIHMARYDEYLKALNDRRQNYHDADVFPEGLDSPLLDLLNARYITLPAEITPESWESLRRLEEEYPTVERGERAQVLENTEALPRAWIVHSARREEPERILELLSSREVDPRQTALLERQPPELARPDDPDEDRTSVTSYEADRIELQVSTGARGLLVLSEVYYPAWNAYVDGERVPIHRADYLLRGVPVSAGEHTVVLKFESRALRVGTAISLVTALVAVAAVILWWRKRAVRELDHEPRRRDPR